MVTVHKYNKAPDFLSKYLSNKMYKRKIEY